MKKKTDKNSNKLTRIKGLRIYFKILLLLVVMFICWRQWRIWSVPDVGVPFDREAYMTRYSEEYRIECAQKYNAVSEGFKDWVALEEFVDVGEEDPDLYCDIREHKNRDWSKAAKNQQAMMEHNRRFLKPWRELVEQGVPIFEFESGEELDNTHSIFKTEIKVEYRLPVYISELMLMESVRLAQAGKLEESLQWQLTARKMANLISYDHGFSQLNEMGIMEQQPFCLLEVLPDASITKERLIQLRESLEEIEAQSTPASETFIVDYCQWDSYMSHLRNAPQYAWPNWIFGENELARRNQNLLMQNILKFCDLPQEEQPPLAPIRRQSDYALFAPSPEQQQKYGTYSAEKVNACIAKMIDPMGRLTNKARIFDQLCPSLHLHRRYVLSKQMHQGVANTLVALQIYHRDKGEFPETLEVLVPEYLTKIPLDAYANGLPISYRREGENAVLWSFWYDKVNNTGGKGVIAEYPNSRDDLCFMVFAPGTSWQEMHEYYQVEAAYWKQHPRGYRKESRDR